MKVFRDPREFQRHCEGLRASGKQIGLFATLGAIHSGHLSLVDRALAENDAVVSSVFVNPGHFTTIEAADAYPTNEKGDIEKLESRGVDAVIVPSREAMYPPGHTTRVIAPAFEGLPESKQNPALVSGISTISTRLYNLCRPHRWYFGEKDVEQIALIRRLAADLNWDSEIVGCPALRDADGLPFSSRNLLLSPEQRTAALGVTDAIRAIKARYDHGERDGEALSAAGAEAVVARGGSDVEYIRIVDPATMRLQPVAGDNAMVVIAIDTHPVRILDSFRLREELPEQLSNPAVVTEASR